MNMLHSHNTVGMLIMSSSQFPDRCAQTGSDGCFVCLQADCDIVVTLSLRLEKQMHDKLKWLTEPLPVVSKVDSSGTDKPQGLYAHQPWKCPLHGKIPSQCCDTALRNTYHLPVCQYACLLLKTVLGCIAQAPLLPVLHQ